MGLNNRKIKNNYFVVIIITVSSLTSLDSSKLIQKRISVNHGASTHLLLHSRNNSSRKEDPRTRNEVHFN